MPLKYAPEYSGCQRITAFQASSMREPRDSSEHTSTRTHLRTILRESKGCPQSDYSESESVRVTGSEGARTESKARAADKRALSRLNVGRPLDGKRSDSL